MLILKIKKSKKNYFYTFSIKKHNLKSIMHYNTKHTLRGRLELHSKENIIFYIFLDHYMLISKGIFFKKILFSYISKQKKKTPLKVTTTLPNIF
jgi:hypothetical protein